jgi:polyisoprenoid-binding protein YceI
MAKQISPHVVPTLPRGRSPIELRIHGGDIFLSGRFHRWQAGASLGHDLDQLSAQIAIDATSPDNLTGEDAGGNLFLFRSTDVKSIGDSAYRATGELVTPQGTVPFELSIRIPEGHTAFFVVSLTVRKEVLGAGWAQLVTGSGEGGIDAERLLDPRTGVRDLPLAVA